MKKIILNIATASNAGTRLAAGDVVAIGTGDDEISADRAKALRQTGAADDAPADDLPASADENIAQDKSAK